MNENRIFSRIAKANFLQQLFRRSSSLTVMTARSKLVELENALVIKDHEVHLSG